MALKALMGRVTDHELNAFEAEEIWVQTETRWVNVSMDGEVSVMEEPLHYRIRPQALRVVVPARNGDRT
jgi:diacylglycerol kinase family enzyme